MPHSLELPGMLRAVIKLVRGERLARLGRHIVDEFVARRLGWTGRNRLSRRCSRLIPRPAAIIGCLNDLPEPSARLRCVQTVRIGRRSLHVINLPPGEVWTVDLPLIALAIRRQNERTLSCADQNSHVAHFVSFRRWAESRTKPLRYGESEPVDDACHGLRSSCHRVGTRVKPLSPSAGASVSSTRAWRLRVPDCGSRSRLQSAAPLFPGAQGSPCRQTSLASEEQPPSLAPRRRRIRRWFQRKGLRAAVDRKSV